MTLALSRRIFLGGGAGLTLAIAGCGKGAGPHAADPHAVNAWLSIAEDGAVTIRVNAVEMGQGAQTGLAQIVADELDADWSKIRVEMAPVRAPYMVKGGEYYTGGSSSISAEDGQFNRFAQAGATARAMLVSAAAKRWQVYGAQCRTANGIVSGPGGKTLGYGALAADAMKEPLPLHVVLKTPGARRFVGKAVPRLDIPDKVNGRTIYGIDVVLPGMLYAAIVHCPYQTGTLAALDETPARGMRGVKHVVRLPGAVAVVADRWWRARRAADALKPRWVKPANAIASDDAMFAAMRGGIGAKDSVVATLDRAHNDAAIARVDAAFAAAHSIFQGEYQVPLLAHAAIEPMNATARVTADGCELWAPMQAQSDMLNDVAKALNLSKDKIVLHTTKIGGGFGRRLKTDFGVQAALIAQATGETVKLLWTREEDMTNDFYRPASICRLRAALREDLTLAALDYQGTTANDTAIGGLARNYGPIETVARQKQMALPVNIGAWRSVDPSITIFFIETLVDEIAHAHGRDPLDYRRLLLANNPRGLRVLNSVAEAAKWGHAPAGRVQGVAFFGQAYWGTAVAEIVELSVDAAKAITIHKVFCAIDPGTAVNPGAVEAQAQGGITLGLSAALGEAITLQDGMVQQRNFDDYNVLRMGAAPDVLVTVLESPDAAIGGCGEPPVPPSMPALANAVFAATGTRVRALPLAKSGFSLT